MAGTIISDVYIPAKMQQHIYTENSLSKVAHQTLKLSDSETYKRDMGLH